MGVAVSSPKKTCESRLLKTWPKVILVDGMNPMIIPWQVAALGHQAEEVAVTGGKFEVPAISHTTLRCMAAESQHEAT